MIACIVYKKSKAMKTISSILLLFAGLSACNRPAASQATAKQVGLYESQEFKQYWYAGKAEINTYNLNQSRYGENRKGKAVLIFVTEDFSKKKQVKLDNSASAGSDNVSVLKMNFTKNFITGIYPYSMMLSAFTPVSRNQYPNSLKFTMSSQEWCGHVFTQMNLKKDSYAVEGYSYFEKESDQHFSVKNVLAEDELMNIIRLNHTELPVGKISVLPGLFFNRLKHENFEPLQATTTKTDGNEEIIYAITYKEPVRTLAIHFTKNFPYTITKWVETFTEREHQMQTTAVLDKTLMIDYWTKNKNEFTYLRDSLNLPMEY
jgi:hypothetical protein